MAAGDFSAVTALNIQEKLLQMFSEPNMAQAEFNTPVATAQALLTRQTARVNGVLTGQSLISGSTVDYKRTIGVNVLWLKSGVDSITYNGAPGSSGLGATLGAGTELEGDSKTYSNNRGIVARVDVNEGDIPGSEFNFDEISAQAIAKGMNDIRKTLNTYLVTFVNANAQVNQDTSVTDIDLGNGSWAVNADTITIEAPKADLKNVDTLAEMDAIVTSNEIFSDYFMLSGRHNFYNAKYNADFKAQNDNERSISATLNAHEMYWDTYALDQQLSGRYTFAISPHDYVIWNSSAFPSVATEISPKDGMWVFSLNDPMLSIAENGTVRPIRYEVVYTREINTSRDSNMAPTVLHKYEIQFVGGVDMAPPEVGGGTGVVRFNGIDAV